MRLKGLYELSKFRVEDESFSAIISFDPEHEIFKGHFPGQPIVPGVCLIHILKEIANRISGDNMQLKKGTNIKFLHLIDPQKSPLVSIKGLYSTAEKDGIRITATISDEEDTFFKFKGIFS